jgi:hypothetical protein
MSLILMSNLTAYGRYNGNSYSEYSDYYSDTTYRETIEYLSADSPTSITYYDPESDYMDNGLDAISTLATTSMNGYDSSASKIRSNYLTAVATSYELPAFSHIITDNVHNIHTTLGSRISQEAHSGSTSNHEHSNWHKFRHFDHSYAKTKTIAGFNSKNYQYIFGYDLVSAAEEFYGLSYSFTASDAKFELGKTNGTINHHNFSFYGRNKIISELQLSTIASLGTGLVNFEQNYNKEYKSDKSLSTFNANVEIKLENPVPLLNNFTVTPSTSLGIDYSKVGGFTEKHIYVPGQMHRAIYQKLGIKINKELAINDKLLVLPEIHYSYKYDINHRAKLKPIEESKAHKAIFTPKTHNKGLNGHSIGFNINLSKPEQGMFTLGYNYGHYNKKHIQHGFVMNVLFKL